MAIFAKKKPVKKEVPFSFVLDELFDLDLTMKPMFGCQALYKGDKLLFILRRKENDPDDNGIWVATSSPEDRQELKKKFPAMRSLKLFGTPDTAWQNIPEDSSDFEESALAICELIRKGDKRIGKITTTKKKAAKKAVKTASKKTSSAKKATAPKPSGKRSKK